MNRFALNGGSLNGAIRGVILATAVVACAATAEVAAVRTAGIQATVAAQASVTGLATYNHKTPAVDFQATGGLFPNATHVHSSKVNLSAGNEILAYVLRTVDGEVSFTSGVDIVAVVASTQGQSNFAASTTVVASATRVQASYSEASGLSTVTLTGNPTITQLPLVQVTAAAQVRAEPHKNNAVEAYWDVAAEAELLVTGLAVRVAETEVTGTGVSASVATVIQPGKSVLLSSGTVIIALPAVIVGPSISINSSVDLVTTATIRKVAETSVTGSGNLTAQAKQEHLAKGTVAATAAINPTANLLSKVFADASALCIISAQAERILQASLAADTVVEILAEAYVKQIAYADLLNQASMVVIAEALNTRRVSATALLDSGVSIYADTLSNPEAYDPEERTFIRSSTVVDFVRPFVETEFKRAA